MNKGKDATRRVPTQLSGLIFTLVLLFLAAAGWAQAGPSTTSPAASPQKTEKPSGATQATPEEQKISPQEAEELFRSVDEILRFASKDTAFPIKHEVKRKLVNRDEVANYVTKNNP